MGKDHEARRAKVKIVSKGHTSFINSPVQTLCPLELSARVSIQAHKDVEISEKWERV